MTVINYIEDIADYDQDAKFLNFLMGFIIQLKRYK